MTEPLKTERQFLKDNHTCDDMLFKTHAPDGIHLSLGQRIEKAIREFAAQQVAAERQRIKNAIHELPVSRVGFSDWEYLVKEDILKLIDSL